MITNFVANEHTDILKVNNLLCDCYKRSRYIPLVDDWPPYHPKHYIPLIIIHHEGRCTESEILTIAQKFKAGATTAENISQKTTKDIYQLFIPFEGATSDPYMILIEGAPGIGKTILSKEITFQWANKNILKNKKLLFLLFVRDPKVKKITDLPLLVKFFCQSDSLTNKITDWLLETGGKYLTIVIDGYDEISTENRNYCVIDRIINRQILPNCDVVITSRPAASLHLHDIVTCRAEVLGFDEKDRQDFIQNALNGQPDKIKELSDYMQSNSSLNTICHIPLNMSILLCLAEDAGISKLPKSQTVLYQKFIIMTIVHFLKKDKIVFDTTIISLDDLPNPYDQVVKELSQFAFLALRKDHLVFTLAEVKAECPNLTPANWDGLGLLKSAQYFKAQDGCDHESFHFLHYSIQEYMAAYHIASLSNDDLLSLLKETFWNARYFNTWVMYVGITGGNHFIFTHFLSGNYFQIFSRLCGTTISSRILKDKIKCLQLLQCSAEADHEMLSAVENIFQERTLDLSNRILSINDVRTLSALLLKLPSKQWKKLDLSDCKLNNEHCNLLCEFFLSNNAAIKIEQVDISNNNFQWESLTRLCEIFKRWQTETLVISIEALYDRATVKVINQFKRKLYAKNTERRFILRENLLLTYLPEQYKMIAIYVCPRTIRCKQYTDCELNDDMVSKISCFVSCFKKTKYWPNITINYNIPGDHDLIERLSEVSCQYEVICNESYAHSRGVFYLNHWSGFMLYRHEKVVSDYVMAAIIHNSYHFDESYSEFIPASVNEDIKTTLKSYPNLVHLCVCDNNLDSKFANDIAAVLSYSINLKILCFANNNLQSKGVIKITQALQSVSKLTLIALQNNNVDQEAANDIASVLSHNTELQELAFNNNNLQSAGAIKISEALQGTFKLKAFEIADNRINKEATNDIATVLSYNTKLQTLDLSRNNLQTTGAINITKGLQNTINLVTLKFADNEISEEAADDIATVLSHNTKLQDLDLSANNLKAVGAIKIAKALNNTYTLTNIDISDNDIGMEGPAATNIATVLSHSIDLRKLQLSGNNLQARSIITIVSSLQKSSWLQVIDFSDNNISEEAAYAIASTLSYNTKLQKINLSRNKLQTTGIIKIVRALKDVPNLEVFNISDNNISGEAARDIAATLCHTKNLQNIDLHHNQLQTEGAIIITKALQNITTLEVFNISNNNISEEATHDIAFILSHNTKLTVICQIYDDGPCYETNSDDFASLSDSTLSSDEEK